MINSEFALIGCIILATIAVIINGGNLIDGYAR